MDISTKSLQEIFDIGIKGLASQNFEKSVIKRNKTTICAYRGDNGCKCFVGHLMADEEYKHEYETVTISNPLILEVIKLDPEEYAKINTLQRLQAIHDRSETKRQMMADYIQFAECAGLVPTKELVDAYISLDQ